MKKSYLTWNRDLVSDDIIFDDIYTISSGILKLDPKDFRLMDARELMKVKKTLRKPVGKGSGKGSYKGSNKGGRPAPRKSNYKK